MCCLYLLYTYTLGIYENKRFIIIIIIIIIIITPPLASLRLFLLAVDDVGVWRHKESSAAWPTIQYPP